MCVCLTFYILCFWSPGLVSGPGFGPDFDLESAPQIGLKSGWARSTGPAAFPVKFWADSKAKSGPDEPLFLSILHSSDDSRWAIITLCFGWEHDKMTLGHHTGPQDAHFRSKALPGSPGRLILRPRTKDFASKGTRDPKIQRDLSQNTWPQTL